MSITYTNTQQTLINLLDNKFAIDIEALKTASGTGDFDAMLDRLNTQSAAFTKNVSYNADTRCYDAVLATINYRKIQNLITDYYAALEGG